LYQKILRLLGGTKMQNSYRRGFDKFKTFVKQNLALIIIIACVIAITTIVIVAATGNNDVPVVTDDPTTEPTETEDPTIKPGANVDNTLKFFTTPVANYTEIGMDYTNDSDNMFVFNGTLDMWMAHRAVDFLAEEGTQVRAMRSGTVTEVGFTYGYGNYIIIDHGDGILATYASLSEPMVTAGQTVAKGAIIAEVSTSAAYEFDDGPHLHLSMQLNGVTVNPWDYIRTD